MEKLWLGHVEEHDFSAAADYLDLLVMQEQRNMYMDRLKTAHVVKKRAADILRAAGLPLLEKEDADVKQNIKKLKKGKKLSPVLLVRMDHKLIIADGYHRICAAYYLTEDLEVPCLLA